MPSPWEAALGDAVDGLRPELRAYFAAIPTGHVGEGAGVFERTIHLRGRDLTMRDETVATAAGVVVDRIGRPVRLEVALRPSVRLTERFDGGRQHVALTVDVPGLGRISEYAGSFTYAVRQEERA